MKPERISVEQATQLRPACLRRTIPEEYLDLNNHMNLRWYVALFDDASDTLHDHLGLASALATFQRTRDEASPTRPLQQPANTSSASEQGAELNRPLEQVSKAEQARSLEFYHEQSHELNLDDDLLDALLGIPG
jgi:hypothetical protein